MLQPPLTGLGNSDIRVLMVQKSAIQACAFQYFAAEVLSPGHISRVRLVPSSAAWQHIGLKECSEACVLEY